MAEGAAQSATVAEGAARAAANPWPVIGTTCLGAFVGQLDASIVQLALPALERAFDAPLHLVGWVAVAYSLAFAAALPVFARLAEIKGRRGLYLAGFALFGLFSLLCGLAPDLPTLIALRTAQGMAGAMLGANSVVILVAAAGPERRGQAMGVFAAAQAVGVSAGPAIGGLLLQGLSWHWVFWVAVPVALLGAGLGWVLVPRGAPPVERAPLDWPGALLLVPALALLLLSLTRLSVWGPLSPLLLGCAGGAVLLMLGFIWRESRAKAPLVALGLFASRSFTGGIVAVVLCYAMLYGLFFGMSFALVRGFGEAPLQAGLRLAAVPVALGLVAPFSGALAERAPRLTRLAGMILCGGAALALHRALPGGQSALPVVMAALGVYGAGLGLFIAPNNHATLAAAPPERSGQAGGLLNLMRAFGTAIGVAGASTLLSLQLGQACGCTLEVAEPVLLAAVGEVMLALAVLALLAAATLLLRDPPSARAG